MLKFYKKPLTTEKIFRIQHREDLLTSARLWNVEINKNWKNEKIQQKILEKVHGISLGQKLLS